MPTKESINPQTGLPYAVNPQTGVFDDNYWANVVEPQLRSGGGQSLGQYGGGQAVGGGGGDVLGLAQQIAGFGQQQQSGVVNSLSDRYKALLEQVGNQASRELGARGIPISSDMSQTFIRNRQGQDPSVLNAGLQLNQQQNLPYQQGLEAAMAQLQNQPQMARLDFDRQKFDYQKQQDALNRQSLGGLSGGMGGGGFQPTTPQPGGAPGAAQRPTAGFQPLNTAQQQSNNLYGNIGLFSNFDLGANAKYAASGALKAAQSFLSRPNLVGGYTGGVVNRAQQQVQKVPTSLAAKTYTATTRPGSGTGGILGGAINTAKNLYSGATNYLSSLFGRRS